MADTRTTGSRRTLFRIAALALLLILSIWLMPRLLSRPTPIDLTQAPGCDLARGSCVAGNDHMAVSLELSPHDVRSLEPLNFSVKLEGTEASAMKIRLEGRDMYMGLNEIGLQPATSGLWQGRGELAVCTTGRMVWRATVLAMTPTGPLSARFEFSAK